MRYPGPMWRVVGIVYAGVLALLLVWAPDVSRPREAALTAHITAVAQGVPDASGRTWPLFVHDEDHSTQSAGQRQRDAERRVSRERQRRHRDAFRCLPNAAMAVVSAGEEDDEPRARPAGVGPELQAKLRWLGLRREDHDLRAALSERDLDILRLLAEGELRTSFTDEMKGIPMAQQETSPNYPGGSFCCMPVEREAASR